MDLRDMTASPHTLQGHNTKTKPTSVLAVTRTQRNLYNNFKMRILWLIFFFCSTCTITPWGKGAPSSPPHEDAPSSSVPPYWRVLTQIPSSSQKMLRQSFHRETLPHWIWILGSSYLLYEYDGPILRETQRVGRQIGLGNKDNTKAFFKVGEVPLFRGPTDASSLMYFLGDGWFHTFIGSSFLLRGGVVNSSRAMNTGWAIFHGMATSTLFNQFLKRATGRESPNQRTTPRGAWRPFPSFKAYQSQTAKYDAVPSGHIMTATLTLTVIQQNYPEYTYFVTPLGWTLITLLSFQMVNNGVHWASDYPLGIAMGILLGRIAANQFPTTSAKKASNTTSNSLQKKGFLSRRSERGNGNLKEKKFALLPYSNRQGIGLYLGWVW